MKSLLIVALLAFFAALVVANEERVTVAHRAEESLPQNWKIAGKPKPSAVVNFTVQLKQKNLDVLSKAFDEVSDPKHANYGKFWSMNEIEALTAPSQDVVMSVYEFLAEHKVSGIMPRGDHIRVAATVETVEKMFQTTLHIYQSTNSKLQYIRNLGSVSIPASLKDSIHFVAGLSELMDNTKLKPKTTSRRTSDAANDLAITPQVLRSYYNVTASKKATNPKSLQAVIAFTDYFSSGALKRFDQTYNEVASIVNKMGTDCLATGCDQVESDLDVQYMTSLGQNVSTWFWGHDTGYWILDYAQGVTSTPNVPYIHSISYGWDETKQCEVTTGCSKLGYDSKQYVARTDTELQKMGLRGITVFVSSGDSGANGNACESFFWESFKPDYPTGSPYVVSVGATQFISSGSSIEEVACSIKTGALITTGGGFSAYQTQPSWQQAAVSKYLSSGVKLPPSHKFLAGNRAYPDISLNGHGYVIYQSDDDTDACPCSATSVDGTSCSSPSIAALFSLINDDLFNAGKSPLGFVNPLLYQMAAAQPSTIFDVVKGNNNCNEQVCCEYGFEAAPGWDPTTGLGTPNWGKMRQYILSLKGVSL